MTDQRADIKRAVAMRYNPGEDEAPVVVGKGKGHVAQKILHLAEEHNIPVQEDPSLVEVLSQIDLNRQIPPELYQVVAEVMAFIYRADQKAKDYGK
ncbi:MAG: EscU/YscU/HrcU family type III secretion system export apparatus switch protein [Bacillaceae bacterium]|nr:EscU/YscU/HrcU family type III secretion system export apparatus switch protein [Bacillaceae bacterium]